MTGQGQHPIAGALMVLLAAATFVLLASGDARRRAAPRRDGGRRALVSLYLALASATVVAVAQAVLT